MKSLEKRFNKEMIKNQDLSTHGWFKMAIEEQGFSRKIINLWFRKLVDKTDYGKKDIKAVLDDLEKFSKRPEAGIKQG